MMKGFKIYQIDTANPTTAFSRRDFYTICLLTGPYQVQRADQENDRDGTYLFFGSPPSASLSKGVAARQTGYACRFTEEFFKESGPALQSAHWSLLQNHAPRAFSLPADQAAYLTGVFQKMLTEQGTEYLFKQELLRSYLQLVLHEALRLRTPLPNRFFRYYSQQPGPLSELRASWRSRQRLPD